MEEEHYDREWRGARHDSYLDSRMPLGMPRAGRVELGESVAQYYKRKHATQGHGKYYGLHLIAPAAPWLK
jgi:hypothetical protein